MRPRPIHRPYDLLREQSGVAYLEFALTIPVLLSLLLGGVEMTRYILMTQKVEKIAITIPDVVSQGSTISTAELDNIILAAAQIMQPYEFGARGYVIITSVKQTGNYSAANPPRVNWQYRGGGSWLQNSRVGSPGTSASLPNNITLFDKENVIVTEVFYNFSPLLVGNGIVSNSSLYRSGVFKPRLGDLSTLSSLPWWLWLQKGVIV